MHNSFMHNSFMHKSFMHNSFMQYAPSQNLAAILECS